MSYNSDHYRMNDKGFESQAEIEKAAANGHVEKTSNGYVDMQTGDEYWLDGEKK